MPTEYLADHLDSLRRTARSLTRNHEDAEDLVQDTLVRVLAKPRDVGPAGAGPYLHRALRNTHVSTLRTRGRRPVLTPLEPDDPRFAAPSGGEPDEIVHSREVLAAIRELPASQRDVLAAVDVAGLGYAEAADHLQIPVGTVMSRLHRGRKRLAPYAAAA
jgi:RNA polymerase sigma-70 factor (ECF subfamily)